MRCLKEAGIGAAVDAEASRIQVYDFGEVPIADSRLKAITG
jgi:hypothetical protein